MPRDVIVLRGTIAEMAAELEAALGQSDLNLLEQELFFRSIRSRQRHQKPSVTSVEPLAERVASSQVELDEMLGSDGPRMPSVQIAPLELRAIPVSEVIAVQRPGDAPLPPGVRGVSLEAFEAFLRGEPISPHPIAGVLVPEESGDGDAELAARARSIMRRLQATLEREHLVPRRNCDCVNCTAWRAMPQAVISDTAALRMHEPLVVRDATDQEIRDALERAAGDIDEVNARLELARDLVHFPVLPGPLVQRLVWLRQAVDEATTPDRVREALAAIAPGFPRDAVIARAMRRSQVAVLTRGLAIGRQWNEQEGFNQAELDELAEAVRIHDEQLKL